ncbi:hypothetical protein DFJ73DRAFT_848793 [Zopfochytrium polystomum]|nr:hypothetical protein DFJ73DRAFT_848793 [Zopfochytrium polystomum]
MRVCVTSLFFFPLSFFPILIKLFLLSHHLFPTSNPFSFVFSSFAPFLPAFSFILFFSFRQSSPPAACAVIPLYLYVLSVSISLSLSLVLFSHSRFRTLSLLGSFFLSSRPSRDLLLIVLLRLLLVFFCFPQPFF